MWQKFTVDDKIKLYIYSRGVKWKKEAIKGYTSE